MKRSSKIAVMVLAVALSWTCSADEVYDETTGFVTLTKSDGSSGAAGHSLNTPGNWSDGLAPHNDPPTNYYVQSGWHAYADDGELTFPAPLYLAGTAVARASISQSATFADLKMLDGGAIAYSLLYSLCGNITVLATDTDNPAMFIYWRNNLNGMKLCASLSGAANSQIAFLNHYPAQTPWLRIMSGSDWSEFEGTFRIDDGLGLNMEYSLNTPGTVALGSNAWMCVNAGYPCTFGGLQFGDCSTVTNSAKIDVAGTLRTGTNMTWRLLNGASRVSTVGTLEITDGTYMNFTAPSGTPESFYVTNRLMVGSNVSMYYEVDGPTDGTQIEFPIFRLSPEAVSAGMPDFASIKLSVRKQIAGGTLPLAQVDVRDNPEVPGGKIAYLTTRKVIHYCGGDQLTEENCKMDTDVSQVGVWTDGQFPHPDCDYYLGSRTNIAFRAPNNAHPNRVTTFPGGALVLDDQAFIYLFGAKVNISNLHAYARGYVYARSESYLNGKLTLHRHSDERTFTARMYNSRTLHLESDIYGDGDMKAEDYYPTTDGGATLYLGGVNTNWTGRLTTLWTKRAGTSPDASETVHVRIVTGDARSLGGGNAEFRHNAIQLDNYSELRLTNTTEFAEANRGLLISENGCLNVDDGKTATLRAPLTLDGTLRKIGDGTLALGGRMRFGLNDELEDEIAPTADRNVVLVQSGSLKVVGAGALDGVAVSFADGTSLHLDLRPADEGMQQNGFAFTNALSSVTCAGTLPVVFDGGSIEDVASGVTVPICTVDDAAAAATLVGRISACLDTEAKRYHGELAVRENANGTATILATFKTSGLTIIFR